MVGWGIDLAGPVNLPGRSPHPSTRAYVHMLLPDLFKAGKGPDPKLAKTERAKTSLDDEMDAYWEARNK